MSQLVSFPQGCTYGMTVDGAVAFSNGYIGEQLLTIKKLNNAMHFARYGYFMQPTMMYYFGVPDKRLMDLFDLKEISDHKSTGEN